MKREHLSNFHSTNIILYSIGLVLQGPIWKMIQTFYNYSYGLKNEEKSSFLCLVSVTLK